MRGSDGVGKCDGSDERSLGLEQRLSLGEDWTTGWVVGVEASVGPTS